MAKNEYSFNKNEKFINPYNFVKVNLKQTPRKAIEEYKSGELFTGYLDCELKSVTPLAILDTENISILDIENVKGGKHKKYGIYKLPHNDTIAISGSTLRGSLRSIYETITNSCFVTSKPKEFITKRAGMGESGLASLLVYEDGQWNIYEAERYLFVVDDIRYKPFRSNNYNEAFRISRNELEKKYKYGQKVYFSEYKDYISEKGGRKQNVGSLIKSLSDLKDNTNNLEGYLYIGEVPLAKDNKSQTTKHFESIFVKQQNLGSVSQEEIDGILTIYDQYNDEGINQNLTKNRRYYQGIKELIKKRETVPIWFNDDTDKFSIAAIGRIVFKRNKGDIIGAKKPCISRSSVCPACALFGMSKDESIGSRVRISDAVLTGDPHIIENVVLKELAGPKISFIPFYAKQKQGNNSKYDYDIDGVEINGRKYYWHHKLDSNGDLSATDYETSEKTERNATVDLIDKDSHFKFRVYFDNITAQELKELKWVLTLGENNLESTMCHKIGHGKPLGLGSAKIVIKKETLRYLNPYKCDVIDEKDIVIENVFSNSDTYKELTLISDMNSVKNFEKISYPYVTGAKPKDNNTAAHQWFGYVNDRKMGFRTKLSTITETLELNKHFEAIDLLNNSGSNNFTSKHVKNNNPVIEVIVEDIDSRYGDVYFHDGDKKGTIMGRNLNNKAIKKGDKIKVRFYKTNDKGFRYYDLID